ncbi:hypothetical protein FQN60_017250 [Etheostoma spectabile]|uniref:Protein kinase domain-containing protein n=1 Tax=Etheostoma spectabile TaxID=54343 RepID=A0A5J5DEZ7_9PERO|nr:hypothetical protein FQN60_017250 [Etheostoma spectabile]
MLTMANPVKKGEKWPLKSRGIQSKASHDLRRLQSLLAKSIPRHEVAALSHSKARSSGASKSQGPHTPKDTNRQRSESDVTSEASELEKFSITYRDRRCFSSHPLHKLFSDILASLVKNRLCSEWIDHALPESVLRVLICLRLLIRDPFHQKILHQLQGINLLARYMEHVTAMYISCGEQAFAGQKLVTMTYMFQKLSAVEDQRVWVIESGAHKTLVKLLSTTESSVLLGALLALTTLAESPECKEEIGKLPIVENLLVILQEYDLLSKRMSAELLRLLSPVWQVRDQLMELEGLPVLLSLLYSQHLKLLDRQYVSDRSSIETLSSANAAGRIQREHIREELSPQEEVDNTMALQSACCTVLTELSLDDTSAHHIAQENGVYIIAKLILPQNSRPKVTSLQCYAFRTLRFLFSVERNRHLFKRLFPTDLFELFIDVGHYVRDLAAYEGLQTKVSLYTEEELDSLRENIETVDQNRPPLKVRKQSSQNLLALKEVNLHKPAFGNDKKSRDSNVEKIISELTIVKEQAQSDKLYIVMELIEGVPLAEHLNSLKEKQQKFTEDRIWNVFIQMCLALRYLHKEKRIVHRDLTPNNIMLGEKERVTITDFGLAKQKQENSKLTSVVGTILYSCPEVVKNEPYGERADVWALGCILYQMATLQPPFYSSNMLSLASKIVKAVYEPIEEGAFSERVTDMIRWCLNPDADQRPDIVAVSSRISDLMMRLMDGLYTSQNALERRAERDRKRAQKYFLEKHKSRTDCCLTNLSQEKSLMKTESQAAGSSATCTSHHSEQNISQDDASDGDVEPCNSKIDTTASTGKHYVGILLLQRNQDQLPPTPHHNIKRRIIERFKKSLFHYGSDPYILKVELSKLLHSSPELMELGSTSSDWWPLAHHFTADTADSTGDGNLKDGVTYQQMQGIIEELLEENSYYKAPQQDSREKK